tara:strand:- start:389 stop:1126 length:738 start_codon:yes stop_codon:yes gene_type:complete
MYFVANWKMFGNSKSVNSIKKVINLTKISKYKKAKIIYCPPYTIIQNFVKKTRNTKINIGAQDCHYEQNFGAYTGSINAKMIKEIGANYIILGHSESRKYGDTNKKINLKIKSSLAENLKVIFCFGETLVERKNKKTYKIINNQIKSALKNVKILKNIIFAYEPVWSIGTGKILKTKELNNQIVNIKKNITKNFKVKNPVILYGGSVNPKNIKSLIEIKSLSGFLIGGASQNAKKFIDIIKKSIN